MEMWENNLEKEINATNKKNIETIKEAIKENKTVIMKQGISCHSQFIVCNNIIEKENGEVFFYFRPAKMNEVFTEEYINSEEYINKVHNFDKGDFLTDEEVEAFSKSKKRKLYNKDNGRYAYCKSITKKSCSYGIYTCNHIFIDNFKIIDKK